MGIAERKEREKRQRKELILEAARKLFQERGFLNVTISDLAEAAELSIGTLYLYFKNKDDIYAGLACLGSQKVDALLDTALHRKKKLTQAELVSFIEKFMRIYDDYGCYFDILMFNFKGKGTINLSDGYANTLREITQSSMRKSIEYFSSRLPKTRNDKTEAARAATFVVWALLLGLTQVLNVGRTEIFNEEDVQRVINKAAKLLSEIPPELTLSEG